MICIIKTQIKLISLAGTPTSARCVINDAPAGQGA